MKMIFMRIVISPKVRGRNILSTHGTLEIGDVPRSALQEMAIPMLIENMPKINIKRRWYMYWVFMH